MSYSKSLSTGILAPRLALPIGGFREGGGFPPKPQKVRKATERAKSWHPAQITIIVIWDEAKTSVLSPILHNVLLSFVTAILDTMSSSISLNFDDISLVEPMRHAAGASPETPIVGGSRWGNRTSRLEYIDYWN